MATDPATYRKELLAILRAHSEQALQTLRALDAVLPPTARAMQIGGHPSQEQDGTFTVMIHLDGPDLYVLNKAIARHRMLFDIQYDDEGHPVPAVPLFNPFDQPFGVNDMIVDSTFEWLEELWSSYGGTKSHLPVEVFGEDDFGSEGRRQLA